MFLDWHGLTRDLEGPLLWSLMLETVSVGSYALHDYSEILLYHPLAQEQERCVENWCETDLTGLCETIFDAATHVGLEGTRHSRCWAVVDDVSEDYAGFEN